MIDSKSKYIDLDKIFIFILPIIFIALIFILDGESFYLSTALIITILIYELFTFRERTIYGLNGFRILSIPSLMFISFTALIAIPGIYITVIKTNPMRFTFFYAILSFYFIFPLGLKFANILFPIDISKIPQLYKPGLVKSSSDKYYYELLIILLSISILILFDYLFRVDKIPLFELLKNPRNAYKDLFMLREESMKLLDVTFIEKYLFSWLNKIFLPLGILGSLFLTILYKKRKYIKLFMVYLFVGLFNNSLTIAKAPTAAIILSILLFYFLMKQKVTFKFIISSIIMVFAFPFTIIYFSSIPEIRQFDNLLINGMLNRIFVIPSEVLYQYFRIFPNMHSFLQGRGTNLFAWFYPEGNFHIINYVAKIWWDAPQTTGSANAIYLGNFWADFGWAGIIIVTFLIGMFVHFFHYLVIDLSEYKKTIEYMIVMSLFSVIFTIFFISTSFTVLLFTEGLLIIMIIILLIRGLKNMDRKNNSIKYILDKTRGN
jgi:oligosaccharide repeat unit polymerase